MSQSSDAYSMKPPPPRFALITPSASPPVSRSVSKRPQPPPAKRPRLSSTPASSRSSLSRSTPVPAAAVTEQSLHDARRASSQRVLSIWESLAERYAKALDEDDIVDLRSGKVIKDRGVMRSKNKIPIGYFAGGDPDEAASKGGGEEVETGEEDTDADPLDAFAPDEDVPEEFKLEKDRWKVPPVQVMDPADAEDLKAFLEAEKVRKETCGVDDEDEEEDEHNVLDVLGSDGWVTTDGDELHGSDDGGSEASDTNAAPEAVRRVQAERALTVADGSDDDELLAWSEGESAPVQPTPVRSSPPENHIIDLTTPSPPNSPVKRELSKTVTKAKRSSSQGPNRAESKTPAIRRFQPIAPSESPIPIVQLQTPPRSQSQSSPLRVKNNGGPSSSRLPLPQQISLPKSTPRPRPRPTPLPKIPLPADLSADVALATPSEALGSLNLRTPAQQKTPFKRLTSKFIAEIVLPKRATARAQSVAPREPSEILDPPMVGEDPLPPSTPGKGKGKGTDLSRAEPSKAARPALVDDSPSPPRPQRWKPRFQRTNTILPIPSIPDTGRTKRKRMASSSSSSSSLASPESRLSSPSPPLADRLRSKNQPPKTPSKTPPKSKAKPKSTAKPKATPVRRSDHEISNKPKQRSSSRPRTPESPSSANSIPTYPYSMPYTPHRGDDQEHPGHRSPYPPIPPMLPIHDPKAQYYFAQAVHHLSYLMSGALPPPGPPGFALPPFPIPYHHQQQQKTPRRHRRRDESPSSSSPIAGSSSSHSLTSMPVPFSTPHHPHPYPFTFDPAFSSGTLPPSSPPPSSPSSPPVVERRPALVNGRSRSRGRRVSFKLDDNERPRVQQEEEEEEPDPDADTSMHTVHMSSPPSHTQRRSRSRARDSSPSPTKAKAKPKPKRITVAEEPQPNDSDSGSRSERGRTPGPRR